MYNRFLVGIISGVILLVGLITTSSASANKNKQSSTKVGFHHYTITAPFKVSLPVIALDLIVDETSSVDELIVIGEDDANQTWLAAYVFNEKANDFVLLDKLALTEEYFAFDVSENKGALYFLAKNKVVSLKYNADFTVDNNVKSGLYLQNKQKVNSIFLLSESTFITKKDFIQDINNDGYDDIVLPDFDQTNLWLSSSNHSEAFYQHLAIKTQVELDRGAIRFKPTKLYFVDLDLDKQQDIAWISKGYINYFSQNQIGQFSTEVKKIELADSIYGLNWWNIKESDGENLDQSNLTHRAVEEVNDINGDGLPDVVVRFTQSFGVLDRTNDYEFYLGHFSEEGQLEIPKIPNTVIKAEGTLTGLKIIDVNKDGKLEVLVSSFKLSVSNVIGALLSGGIDQNVLLFALNDENRYEEDPFLSKEVELSFSLTSGQSGQPIVLLSDVNGDGLLDLVLSSGREQLSLFLGSTSPKFISRKASKYKVTLPKNGELFESYDINNDGNKDFIMRYGRLDDKSMINKISILLVK